MVSFTLTLSLSLLQMPRGAGFVCYKIFERTPVVALLDLDNEYTRSSRFEKRCENVCRQSDFTPNEGESCPQVIKRWLKSANVLKSCMKQNHVGGAPICLRDFCKNDGQIKISLQTNEDGHTHHYHRRFQSASWPALDQPELCLTVGNRFDMKRGSSIVTTAVNIQIDSSTSLAFDEDWVYYVLEDSAEYQICRAHLRQVSLPPENLDSLSKSHQVDWIRVGSGKLLTGIMEVGSSTFYFLCRDLTSQTTTFCWNDEYNRNWFKDAMVHNDLVVIFYAGAMVIYDFEKKSRTREVIRRFCRAGPNSYLVSIRTVKGRKCRYLVKLVYIIDNKIIEYVLAKGSTVKFGRLTDNLFYTRRNGRTTEWFHDVHGETPYRLPNLRPN
ncbi:unnamed protein product [Bursaphelenchus xylophilus]|uniref:(pine wood nematode) hypothetical protein n=1 Tax=Bursaphelenchus xylophilus TaxID=6326 RepID=A0A1I7RPI9_BURXY|nr:unnamed protein product [Bursaphelenchus xylophilus]CAG9096099.1 unnamed protein product [Bursaphelenchus xylophilus]